MQWFNSFEDLLEWMGNEKSFNQFKRLTFGVFDGSKHGTALSVQGTSGGADVTVLFSEGVEVVKLQELQWL